MYNLYTEVLKSRMFGGSGFFVPAGKAFDADTFAEVYSLNRADLDPDDIHATQDEAARLLPGEWLSVTYELK